MPHLNHRRKRKGNEMSVVDVSKDRVRIVVNGTATTREAIGAAVGGFQILKNKKKKKK